MNYLYIWLHYHEFPWAPKTHFDVAESMQPRDVNAADWILCRGFPSVANLLYTAGNLSDVSAAYQFSSIYVFFVLSYVFSKIKIVFVNETD